MTIHYEKHPVSPERMAELKKQGVKILDARFQPKSERPRPVSATENKPKGKSKE
jgi:hypothetical protein